MVAASSIASDHPYYMAELESLVNSQTIEEKTIHTSVSPQERSKL